MSLDNRKKTGLGEKIDSHEFDFDSAAWDDMEVLLDGKKPSKKVFPFRWFFKILGGLILLMGIALYFISQNEIRNLTKEKTELEAQIPEIAPQEEIGHSAETEIVSTTGNKILNEEKALKTTKPLTEKKTVEQLPKSAVFSSVPNRKQLDDWDTPYVPDYVWENTNSNFVQNLNSKLIAANQKSASKKVYLQLNKTVFESGEKISFNTFIRGANSLNPINENLQLTLEDSSGGVLRKISLAIKNGTVSGTLKLPEKESGGIYKLKIYDNNQNKNAFHVKAISVLEKGAEVSLLEKEWNQINLQFFPEGGDLIADFPTKIAFKSVNELGKPIDVEGVILDENSKVISKFNSYHDGMGGFDFSAKANKKYTAKITNPIGIEKIYPLPEVNSQGFSIRFKSDENGKTIFKCSTTENEVMKVVVRSGGKIVQSKSIFPPAGFMKIEKANLSVGIAQITIFDSYHVARSERLFFVKNDEKLNVDFKTDKENYSIGEKVSMSVKVTDVTGRGVSGQFSVSVTDKKIESQENILSALLLESELKNNIHNSGFYFENEASNNQILALDYLMLTSHWERLAWETIVYNPTVEETVINVENESNSIPTIKGELPKTIYWNPKIKTDQNGRATVEFIVPDNVEACRVNFEGIDNNGRIGYKNQLIPIHK